MTQTIFEKTQAGQRAYSLPKSAKEFHSFLPPKALVRQSEIDLPEISEIDLMRHFSLLAHRNMGIDTNFYPLGSCTMKFNPRINEYAASLSAFTRTHPLAPEGSVQGNLQIIHELVAMLCEVTGMAAGSLLPNAGAQGEFVGTQIIAAYHRHNKEEQRDEILIPDNAHGTNPATAAMSGFKTISIRSSSDGDMDLAHLKTALSPRTAGLMLTNPNTLGLFSSAIAEITEMVHQAGGLLYYDGANLNSILNVARPAQMGFDLMHINLHKTFSTPHGGGGPGAGPVLCVDKLKSFLPEPRVELSEGRYRRASHDKESIGSIASFYGNFLVCVRAYLYAKLHGHFGLRKIAEMAVLNANYLKERLSKLLTVPFPQGCMHEFVVQADRYLDVGIRALDIAKRLLDYGVYAPTIYFPLIVKECMLIEPTESESKRTLDQFVSIMEYITEEIKSNPDLVRSAPHHQVVARLNEVQAAKKLILKE